MYGVIFLLEDKIENDYEYIDFVDGYGYITRMKSIQGEQGIPAISLDADLCRPIKVAGK